MFTGIIEEIGILKTIKSGNSNMVLEIKANIVTADIKNGDSIAVNGTCLTVTAFNHKSFCVDVMPETYNTTSLKTSKELARVNLERALRADSRLGGHFVSGHVDGIGTIIKITPQENAVYFDIKPDNPELLQYCMYHGSIAIDGTSLTIFGVTDESITISLIPHTMKNSIIGYKQTGDVVNIECDMLAKFVAQAISHKHKSDTNNNKLNQIFLQQHGYII